MAQRQWVKRQSINQAYCQNDRRLEGMLPFLLTGLWPGLTSVPMGYEMTGTMCDWSGLR